MIGFVRFVIRCTSELKYTARGGGEDQPVCHETGAELAEVFPGVPEVSADKDHGLTPLAGPVVGTGSKDLVEDGVCGYNRGGKEG